MSDVLVVHAPSESVEGRGYTLHIRGDVVTCNCLGFTTHGRCKHAAAAKEIVMSENNTALAKRDAPPEALVVQQPPTALLPSRDELTLMTAIAEQAVRAVGVVPTSIKTKEQAVAIMMAGWELGLRPMTALRHVYVVNGKTEVETRAMVGIIKSRRPDITFAWPEYTAEAVTCVVRRPGQPETRVRYTKADATASGQLAKGGPWKSYTRDMLYAAATKRACRLACPDIINGIETSMHTVSEAESLVMPDAEVRVLDDAPALDGIPADAYNPGDDPAEEADVIDAAPDDDAPEPPAPAQIPLGARINKVLRDIADTWDNDAKAKVHAKIDRQFPGAISPHGQLMIGKLDADAQAKLWAWLQKLTGAPEPDGEADGDV